MMYPPLRSRSLRGSVSDISFSSSTRVYIRTCAYTYARDTVMACQAPRPVLSRPIDETARRITDGIEQNRLGDGSS